VSGRRLGYDDSDALGWVAKGWVISSCYRWQTYAEGVVADGA
jgi:hypothetical protein